MVRTRNAFQFHFGSVERIIFHIYELHMQHFNSTLVRLKDYDGLYTRRTAKLFQFHFGSVERNSRSWDDIVKRYFNSTLVRLKVVKTIYRFYFSTYISIPLWFGWKDLQSQIDGNITSISIPLWFGWKKCAFNCLTSSIVISIPLWFGWKAFSSAF